LPRGVPKIFDENIPLLDQKYFAPELEDVPVLGLYFLVKFFHFPSAAAALIKNEST
jgi:hypothetical protein